MPTGDDTAHIPDRSQREIADAIALASFPPVLMDRVVVMLPEYVRQFGHSRPAEALADLLLATAQQSPRPEDLFSRLRWGGVVVISSQRRWPLRRLALRLEEIGFTLERPPSFLREGWIPFFRRKHHYLVARKMQLLMPGQTTERFTYHVQLVRNPNNPAELVVLKEIPTFDSLMFRLRRKFPDVAADVLERRAHKFLGRIFPTFLTREAAILMILEEHLPAPYNRRVPRVVKTETDDRGFVRKLWMTWLRNGGRRLGHMEFAHQAADLLRAIHDIARVIHLDLRLDNFVITEDGVGFVDFGSAVRDTESFSGNPMLSGLFEELMRTSQIQRALFQMSVSGQLTSDIILQSHQKAHKAIDFFYLAVQFNCPHSNPDLSDLIEYDPNSKDARDLAKLTLAILRPADPANPIYRSAKDILHGIERMQLHLDDRHKQPRHPA